MKINLDNYKVILKKDCYSDTTYGIILLNKKHTVEEFQEEINKAKEQAQNEINKYGDDWYFITKYISKDFDYIELGIDEMRDFIDF